MNQKGFSNIALIIVIIVLVGIAGYFVINRQVSLPEQISPSSPSDSENQTLEKTALLSFTEFFCYWTEQSKPFAYFQFAYQEDGEIKYVRTKTTCDDLIEIGASNDASKNPTLFGEKIRLGYRNGKPVNVIRENGNDYRIEASEQIRSFFSSNINVYDNLKYFRNSNPDEVTNECLLINNDPQHDRCLSYQAAFQKNADICNEMRIISNQNLCRQWVTNLEQGSVNN